MKHVELHIDFGSSVILGLEPQLEYFQLHNGDFVTLEGFDRTPKFFDIKLGVQDGMTFVTLFCDLDIVVKRDGMPISAMSPPP